MGYIDTGRLASIAEQSSEFLGRRPYPHIGLQGVINDDGFRELYAELPDLGRFEADLGGTRGHGQKHHDRYALQYTPRLDAQLSPAWRSFIGELQAPPYQDFLRRMYGLSAGERCAITMHWHFAPSGASVSAHTDASRKIGSHIFYFNTRDDWDEAWGGQTLVLDDDGRLSRHDAPEIDTLRQVGASEILGNRSFMFKRNEHSWHAVRPIACPPGRLRKVFIVVVNRMTFQVAWRRIRGKDADGYRL